MGYGTPADKIVAYTYNTETLCPTCTIEALIAAGMAAPGARSVRVEDALDQIADANVIDRMDEHSFDSGDFPKVVFASQVNAHLDHSPQDCGYEAGCTGCLNERCDHCGEELV